MFDLLNWNILDYFCFCFCVCFCICLFCFVRPRPLIAVIIWEIQFLLLLHHLSVVFLGGYFQGQNYISLCNISMSFSDFPNIYLSLFCSFLSICGCLFSTTGETVLLKFWHECKYLCCWLRVCFFFFFFLLIVFNTGLIWKELVFGMEEMSFSFYSCLDLQEEEMICFAACRKYLHLRILPKSWLAGKIKRLTGRNKRSVNINKLFLDCSKFVVLCTG